MTWRKAFDAFGTTILLCLSCLANPALAGEDHRVEVKNDRRTTIVPTGTLISTVMSMLRHPDGAIFLSAQFDPPKLLKSVDNGETRNTDSVKLTDGAAGVNRWVPHNQP